MKKAKSLLALILSVLMIFSSAVCAFAAADPTETEDNSDFATADTLGLGSGIKGKIDEANDVDTFVFTATESGLVTVTLAHDEKTNADAVAAYFEVTVVDAADEFIDSFKSTGRETTKSIDFSVNPGSYYVQVKAGNILDTTLEYTLSAKINKTALYEKEPNNMSSQATVMQLSSSKETKLYYGAITAEDVDYYQVTFSKPSLAMFGIYNTTSKTGDYKASLVKIVDGLNGTPAEKVVGTISIGDGEEVKDSPLFGVNGGTYYLKVEGISGSTGGYQVRVYAGTSSSTDEYEYNNEEKYANKLGVGKKITGNIFDTTDVDMFVFEAPKSNYGYEIVFADYDSKKDVTNGQWTIEVTDENGDVVEDKITVLNSSPITAETEALEKGLYYIKVKSGNVFTGETYQISLVEKKAPAEGEEPDDDGKITIDEFFSDIKGIDWTGFWKNFEGWLEYVNVIGILSDLLSSVMDFITTFIFANM